MKEEIKLKIGVILSWFGKVDKSERKPTAFRGRNKTKTRRISQIIMKVIKLHERNKNDAIKTVNL